MPSSSPSLKAQSRKQAEAVLAILWQKGYTARDISASLARRFPAGWTTKDPSAVYRVAKALGLPPRGRYVRTPDMEVFLAALPLLGPGWTPGSFASWLTRNRSNFSLDPSGKWTYIYHRAQGAPSNRQREPSE